MRDIAAGDARNVRFSSTMHGSSRISNCHWRTFLLQLRFVSSIDPRTCKQKFHTTHQSRIQQVLVWKLKKTVDERLKKFQYAMWKSERKMGEIGSFFCYDSEKWLVLNFCYGLNIYTKHLNHSLMMIKQKMVISANELMSCIWNFGSWSLEAS